MAIAVFYAVGIAAAVELRYGVRAERVTLEAVAAPLSSQPD